MRSGRSLAGPVFILAVAFVSGGWFFQQSAAREHSAFFRGRLFDQVADLVRENYVDEVNQDSLYRSAIEGLLSTLGDPNTSFLEGRDFENLSIRTNGEYGGVGLEVVERDGFVTVVTAMPGTPGSRAGIRPGDRIVAVDSVEVVDGDADQAVDLLRGPPDTDVSMTIRRPGVEGALTFEVRRALIQVRSVPFSAMLENDLGYVPLQVFSETSTEELEGAIDALLEQGAKGVVVDLRGNPGGVLDAAVAIADLFLPSGDAVLETRGRGQGQSESYRASRAPRYPDLPVAVLVDGASASASEIVAGALQDHDRALLLGERTFGKGSVQTLFPLAGGDVLKLTTARWYTPVGRSIQKERDEQREAFSSGALSLSGHLVQRTGVDSLPRFESVGGRTLVGGGGITPDVRVHPDTLDTEAQEAVYAVYASGGAVNQALFDFVVRTLGERGGEIEVTPVLARELRSHLANRGVSVDETTWQRAQPFLLRYLRSEIALQSRGEEAQFLALSAEDPVLQAALERLRAAGGDAQRLVRDGALAGAP